MYLKPLTRVIDRPIGYVVDSQTIIGEWPGTRWEDVPRKAALYVNDRNAVQERYDAGDISATRWLKGEHRVYGRITGWKYRSERGNAHNLYYLRGILNPYDDDEAIRAIDSFVAFFRRNGTNIGSPVGMLGSLFKRTLTERLYINEHDLPISELWRGARIQHRGGIAAEFPRATLWDMRSAFPAALGNVVVPDRWRHYNAATHSRIPSAPVGFCRAVVRIPPLGPGPLPDVRLIPARYPTDEFLSGVWSFDELRAAEAYGTEVMPLEFWTGHAFKEPYLKWISLLADARNEMNEGAIRILKMASNAYVGTLAMEGRRAHTEMRNGTEYYWSEKGYRKPDSLATHAVVTGNVRSRLYAEAMAPWWLLFVSCHTDGAILLDTPNTLIGTGIGAFPGDWTAKRHMRKVMLLDAQRYAYEDDAGKLQYCVSGVPDTFVESVFMRRWLGKLGRIQVGRRNADNMAR